MTLTPAMAVEVFLGAAVPNLTASQPSLMDGNNNLSNTPPATGTIVVPNTPSGASPIPNNFTGGFNYINTVTSTSKYASSMVKAMDNGVAFNFNQGTPPTPPGYNILETTPAYNPNANSGVQQGTAAISNVTSITSSFAGISPASIAVFRWT